MIFSEHRIFANIVIVKSFSVDFRTALFCYFFQKENALCSILQMRDYNRRVICRSVIHTFRQQNRYRAVCFCISRNNLCDFYGSKCFLSNFTFAVVDLNIAYCFYCTSYNRIAVTVKDFFRGQWGGQDCCFFKFVNVGNLNSFGALQLKISFGRTARKNKGSCDQQERERKNGLFHKFCILS